MILERLLIGGVYVSVRKDPMLGWRATVITAPRHTRNMQDRADQIAADLRKKYTLKASDDRGSDGLIKRRCTRATLSRIIQHGFAGDLRAAHRSMIEDQRL